MINIFLAIIPGILYVYLFYLLDKDRFIKDKFYLLILFILGCIGSYICYRLEMHFGSYFKEVKNSNYLEVFIYSIFGVAIFEEGFKWFVTLIFVFKNKINKVFDIILYSVIITCGFMSFENIVFYIIKYGLNAAISRMFTSCPMHICCGFIMGYYLYRFRENTGVKRIIYFILSIVIPTLTHAFYNMWLYKGEIRYYKVSYIFLFILVFISIRKCVILKRNEE